MTDIKKEVEKDRTRHSATNIGRRGALRTLGAAVVGATLTGLGAGTAAAQENSTPLSVQWEQTYGGEGPDLARDMVMVNDGYVFAGFDGSKPDVGGWVVKLCANGTVAWEQTFPEFAASSLSGFSSIERAPDGGVVLAFDETVLKVSPAGVKQWERDVGFQIRDLVELTGGGYALTGAVAPHGVVAKVTDTGELAWREATTVFQSSLSSIIETTDGSIVAAGFSVGSTGDEDFYGDGLAVKWSSDGEELRTYYLGSGAPHGMHPFEQIYGLTPTPNGGFAYVGESFYGYDFIGDTSGFGTYYDRNAGEDVGISGDTSLIRTADGGYVIGANRSISKVDSSGEILWQQDYGISATFISELIETSDGGYAVAGGKERERYDTETYDAWVVKFTQST